MVFWVTSSCIVLVCMSTIIVTVCSSCILLVRQPSHCDSVHFHWVYALALTSPKIKCSLFPTYTCNYIREIGQTGGSVVELINSTSPDMGATPPEPIAYLQHRDGSTTWSEVQAEYPLAATWYTLWHRRRVSQPARRKSRSQSWWIRLKSYCRCARNKNNNEFGHTM